MSIFRIYLFIVLFLITAEAEARVYWNIHVGEYQRRLNLREFKGQSFLSLMKEQVYPALLEESQNNNTLSPISSRSQIDLPHLQTKILVDADILPIA